MWKEHLQEVINELVTTLRKLPPNIRDRVITLIHKKLSVLPTNAPPRILTHPHHEWLLSPADLLRVPYVPPPEQRVEQRVRWTNMGTNNDIKLAPPLTWITNAPPIMATLNPTTK
jgi:hypothetical protein